MQAHRLVVPFVLCACLSARAACAQDATAMLDMDWPSRAPDSGLALVVGYKLIDIGRTVIPHDTHPEETFLPDSGVPGSAGTTVLDGRLHCFAAGFRWNTPVLEHFSLHAEAGVLGTYERETSLSANDTRPDPTQIYTEVTVGGYFSAGAALHLDRFSVGVTVEAAVVETENGWRQAGQGCEKDFSDMEWAVSVGPTVGVRLTEELSLETTVWIAERASGSVMLVWRF